MSAGFGSDRGGGDVPGKLLVRKTEEADRALLVEFKPATGSIASPGLFSLLGIRE